MAVGRISAYTFPKWALLLVAAFLTSVSSQDLLKPTITIIPRTMRLVMITDKLPQAVSIMCTTGTKNIGKIQSLQLLKLSRKLPSKKEEELMELGENQNTIVSKSPVKGSGKYTVPAAIVENIQTSAVSMTLILNQKQADCRDAGEYICTMIYVGKGGSKSETTSTSDVIDIAPTEFNVTRVPAKVPIKVGMKLQLSCTAVIGTVTFGFTRSQLVWVYRNRQSAIQNQYNPLEDDLMMKFGWSKNVSCSRRESVYLNLTVEKIRDSLRDYICVVKRYTAFGGGVSYVGGSKNNVSLPSFEVPEKKGLGIAGFIGIGVAGLAMLLGAIFGAIWMVRRNKKKAQRKAEIERRKSQIEERRKSIASIIMQKKQSNAGVANDVESSVADTSSAAPESSVADGSSVAPSSSEPAPAPNQSNNV